MNDKSITFKELVKRYSDVKECSQTQAKKDIVTIFDVISGLLSEACCVSIPDFGKFDCKTRAARKGRNPKTGESIEIPETITVSFKPSKDLKGKVSE